MVGEAAGFVVLVTENAHDSHFNSHSIACGLGHVAPTTLIIGE